MARRAFAAEPGDLAVARTPNYHDAVSEGRNSGDCGCAAP
jgi:hypothetical protein